MTYDLHILLRFEMELALIEGRLKVKDLPEAWNTRFHELFGLIVPDDARGVLQDIHWSLGSLGYFPTYTLGNLNAAQLMVAAEKNIPGLSDQLAQGNYASVAAMAARKRPSTRPKISARRTDAQGHRRADTGPLPHRVSAQQVFGLTVRSRQIRRESARAWENRNSPEKPSCWLRRTNVSSPACIAE